MNSRPRLAFERVEIRRMPGIDSGFAVEGLSPGINVICGPNASGKTSLTRAVATLLWPRSGTATRSVLDGTFALDGRAWRVGYDTGSLRCQSDGQDSDFPTFDSADERDRYLLALHDLLRADNRGFAEAILRESTGGYDIGQAANDLGYAAKPSTQLSLNRRLDNASVAAREADRVQDDLRQQERKREDLVAAQDSAREAGRRVQLIERVLNVQRASATRDDASRVLEAFPEILASLTGNELDELQRLRERRAEAAIAVQEERLAIERAGERRDATGLTADFPPGLVARLRSHCVELQEHLMEVRAATERRVAAEAVVAGTRDAIGPDADDSRLAALDPVHFNALAGLMTQSQQAHSTLDGLTAIAMWIPPTPPLSPDQEEERNRLGMGVQCLTRWLRQGRDQPVAALAGSQPRPTLLWVAAGLAVVEALLLGLLAHPSLFVLLLPALALVVLALRRPSQSEAAPATSTDASWRREYEGLGLEAPVRWEPDAVQALADALSRRLRSIDAQQETRQRWQYVHSDRPAAVRQVDAIDAQVAEFCRQFGIPAITDVAALHRLANAISTWQTERSRADAAAALQAEAEARHAAVLRLINADLEPFGYPAANGHADATSSIDDLSAREQEWSDARAEAQRGRLRLDQQLQPQLSRCLADLDAFFKRFDLLPDDEHGLRLLLDQLTDYQEAKRASDRAALELERAQATLGEAAPLAALTSAELDADLDVAQDLSATLESIGQEIATIDARIERARQGHDREAALAAVQSAADNLRDARERNEAQVAGWTLAEFVQQRTRDVDRPRVFHRARELFARITQGRYELDVDGSDPPRFRARDTITGVGHALDELSSGTRLQLLLAVRVAFVEQQERGPMLPLILDETLGNSDEHRARAIIDATVQIAREGRQVLYLTAQHDEVRKWESIMAGQPDVPFALIDLAQVRGLADWERLPPAAPQPWPMPSVPEPNGHNREQYGELLHVPGIDLTAADSGGIHLWHLIDEPSSLHALLSLQIETWGQLRALAEYGGVSLLAEAPDIFDRCRARAQVISTIAESWRIGRGRPVDRSVLLASDAVTDVFIDRVSQLAESLSCDAVALIVALENGQITRFHSAARTRLKEYFEEHGYIDLTPPLSHTDVRARVLASSAPDIAGGLVRPDWVNGLLATLWSDRTESAESAVASLSS